MSDSTTPWTVAPPDSSVNAIFQARILEWVDISSSRDLPDPGTEPASPVSLALAGKFFTTQPPEKPFMAHTTQNWLLM